MQLRNHVVVVVSALVLGASAILGATVQSTTSCPFSGATTSSDNIATSELCASGVEPGCLLPPTPEHPGQHLVQWGASGGCFGSKL
jgi:hypothetical protein